MNKSELEIYNKIQERIDFLEEEIYALTEAKTMNPIKRIIKTVSRTKKKNYEHEVTIKLSLMDIRVLQDIRISELNNLKNYIKDN